ncbi:MAG: DNA repair protein RecO, partial [Gammaproteobacteria bacterium]|nr:DNA repair protein RecO [Gammaproteobacteria bacterium]
MLTAGYGRLALIARGARRPKSRLHGLLQPFQPLFASWSMRGELGVLTAAESRDGEGPHGRTLISGFYMNELLMRLLHRHDPHPQLFGAYESALRSLAVHGLAAAEEQSVLRLFELTLLRELGYGLVLDHEIAGGEPIRSDEVYDYYPERGPVRVDAAALRVAEVSEGEYAARVRPVRLHGASMLALAQGELHDPVQLHEAKRLMRMVLDARLGGKPLVSRKLFRRGVRPETIVEPMMEGEGRV